MADAKGAYIGGVPVQFKDAAARAMISDEYNSAETYAKGNLCIYNGKIYEAIKETTGTWDATAWEETTLAKVNGKLNGDIASLTEKQNKLVNPISYIDVNDWNEAIYPGWYTGNNLANAPAAGYCVGLVLSFDCNPNYPVQLVFLFGSNSIFIRTKTGANVWNEWRTV